MYKATSNCTFERKGEMASTCPTELTTRHAVGYYGYYMNTITIPRKVTKGEELVVISRKVYEEYLQLRKSVPVVKMTSAEKREWERAKKDYEQGKYVTFSELESELGITHKRKG